MTSDLTISPPINEAVTLSKKCGNEVSEISIGWSKMNKVVHMRFPMDDNLRQRLLSDSRLTYWQAERTPHNAADETFTDEGKKVAIVFPIKT